MNLAFLKIGKNLKLNINGKNSFYNIVIKNPNGKNSGVEEVILNGEQVENAIRLQDDGVYNVEIKM